MAIDFPTNPTDGQRSNGYYYDESVGAWKSEKVVGTPSGVIMPFAGAVAPFGFLMADGSTLNRADYPELFAVLGGTGSPYGLPSGTTFKLPDLRSRVPVGYDDPAPWSDFRPLGRVAGERTVTLTTDQLPAHSHTTPNHSHSFSATTSTNGNHNHAPRVAVSYGGNAGQYRSVFATNAPFWSLADFNNVVSDAGNHNHTLSGTTGNSAPTTNNTGGGWSHNNLQPYITLNFIIKT
jgi:microcystin-dependent protein